MTSLLLYFFQWSVDYPLQAVYVWCMLLTTGFLIYTALWPQWKRLPLWAKLWVAPFIVFYPVDIVVRCTIGWLLFLEPPNVHDWTITQLCDKHVNDADGASLFNYKRFISRTLCKVLNILQPEHCEHYKET